MQAPKGFCFITDILGSVKLADGTGAGGPFVDGDWFQLAKTGTFFSPVYGKITISADDLANMFRNFKTKTPLPPTQLPIDYDHLSDEPQKPEDGRAAGWVEDLEVRDGGETLWCKPKWTKRGAELITNGEYRFVSPYFLTDYLDKASGKKIGPTLKAVAITNRPFLEGMQEIPAPAIAASERLAKRLRRNPRVAVPMSMTTKTRKERKLAMAEARNAANGCAHCGAPKKVIEAIAAKEANGVAMDDGDKKAAPAITCPHCGAPVKYSADGGGADMDDVQGDEMEELDDMPSELDEGAGDADALEELDDDVAAEEMEELAEASTDADDDGDPSVVRTNKKAVGVDAEELDDVAADDDASLDDGVEADDTDGGEPSGPGAAPGAGAAPSPAAAMRAKKMAGVKPIAAPAPKPGAKLPPTKAPLPTAPAPALDEAAMRELRSLREATAKLEKKLAEKSARQRRVAGLRLLQRGLREGKLTPRQIGSNERPTYTRRFAMSDPKGFAQWLDKEAPITVEFRERGTAVELTDASSAASTASTIDKMARDLMAKDTTLSYSQATQRVINDNRQLSERYDRDMNTPTQNVVVSSGRSRLNPKGDQ